MFRSSTARNIYFKAYFFCHCFCCSGISIYHHWTMDVYCILLCPLFPLSPHLFLSSSHHATNCNIKAESYIFQHFIKRKESQNKMSGSQRRRDVKRIWYEDRGEGDWSLMKNHTVREIREINTKCREREREWRRENKMKSEMKNKTKEEKKKQETKTLSYIYCITYGLVFFVEDIKYMKRNICHTKVTQHTVHTTECKTSKSCKRERELEEPAK